MPSVRSAELPSFRTTGADHESFVPRNADLSGITPTQDRRTGRPCGQRSARCAAESFPTATSMDFQENIAVEPVPIRAGRRERAALENKVIGVFAVCNTAGICVHEIDHAEDRVLVSMNGIDPEWYPITEKPQSEMGGDSDELESGFEFGSFFVPFSEVMRV